MKPQYVILLTLLLYGFLNPLTVRAITDPLKVPNNRFGIHILYPEELPLASKLVNTNGGDWGYVTIPIQSTDHNLERWQAFMDQAKFLHLIPIVRLTTHPINDYWPKPTLFDAIDFANFLDSLDWPTKNRYVIFYNEPNRAQEWGGEVKPYEYAEFLSNAIDIFKQRSQDFFVLNAGLDAAAPTNHVLMDSFQFMRGMEYAVPGIFNKLDGWVSHSYPNPDYSSGPRENRKNTVYGFIWEQDFLSQLGVKDLPVFITETGWRIDGKNPDEIASFYEEAFKTVWNDSKIVAVTPFLLTAGGGPFQKFSFTTGGGEPLVQFEKIASLSKTAGRPEISVKKSILTGVEIKTKPFPTMKKSEVHWPQLPQASWEDIFKWLFP